MSGTPQSCVLSVFGRRVAGDDALDVLHNLAFLFFLAQCLSERREFAALVGES